LKVLLDENLPHRLRTHLGSHEVFTVGYQGWSGLKNGELLRSAENDGFEVFLTGDQTLPYEQNLTGRWIAVVVLTAIEWHLVSINLPVIQSALDQATPGSYQRIECGLFQRRSPRP